MFLLTRHWLALSRPRPAECYQGAWLVTKKADDHAIAGLEFLINTWGVDVVKKEAKAHATSNNYNYPDLSTEIQSFADGMHESAPDQLMAT